LPFKVRHNLNIESIKRKPAKAGLERTPAANYFRDGEPGLAGERIGRKATDLQRHNSAKVAGLSKKSMRGIARGLILKD